MIQDSEQKHVTWNISELCTAYIGPQIVDKHVLSLKTVRASKIEESHVCKKVQMVNKSKERCLYGWPNIILPLFADKYMGTIPLVLSVQMHEIPLICDS